MRTVLLILPVVGLASANRLAVRQSSATPAPTSTSTGSAAPPPSTEPVTLLTVNPTAVPLASIVSSPVPEPTIPLPTVYQAGAVPTAVPGAPPLPNYAGLLPSNYPALDVVPPTNSPEVQAWIQRVKNSGITIPDFKPTVPGGCDTNPGLVGNATRCWWTCGQCLRNTDISTCPDKLTWGLSYDDGPSPYTPNLLSFLNEKQLKSTFFIVGSRAISRPDILAAEYMQGHQLSVHTWSHTALTTQTNEQIIAELGWTAKVIKDITGVTPNTMRPPYGDIDDRVRAIAMAMGMTPIIWTTDTSGGNYDTNDWHIPAGTVSASGVINEFGRILADATKLNTGFIVLAHDLYQQSVDLATGYVLPDALARQPPFKLESIITCLKKPLEDAYVETNHNDTNPPIGGGTSGGAGTPTGGAQASGAATPMRLADASVGLSALLLGALGLVL